MFFRVDIYDRRSPDERRNHYNMMGEIYSEISFREFGPFIESSWNVSRLYLRSHHDYMPVLLLPHIMAKKASKIYGHCVGNTLCVT